jgi:hypothetical protein
LSYLEKKQLTDGKIYDSILETPVVFPEVSAKTGKGGYDNNETFS